MKETIFVDTGFLVAMVNDKDKNHDTAKKINDQIKNNSSKFTLLYTDYIFDEFIALLKTRSFPVDLLLKIGDSMLASKILQRIRVTDNIFEAAWSMLKKYKDKAWSFTDCTSFVIMNEFQAKRYIGFDDHFSQAGFELWK